LRAGIRGFVEKLWKTGRRTVRVPDLRPIAFRQVCAIARVELLKAPTMIDAEWKAAILETCAKQQWESPDADMVGRAMSAVERAVSQTIGPRPIVEPTAPPQAPKPDKGWTNADYRSFADTVRAVMARSKSAPDTAKVSPITRETWDIDERAAIDQFYAEANTGDRAGALRRFAEIAIVRPADWDVAAVRASSRQHMLHADRCFVCRHERRLSWHHVIQIQHGGSNYLRNRVALCTACHADVHPWLPDVPRVVSASGWTSFEGAMPAIASTIYRYLTPSARVNGDD
jgi:hypothetical protein